MHCSESCTLYFVAVCCTLCALFWIHVVQINSTLLLNVCPKYFRNVQATGQWAGCSSSDNNNRPTGDLLHALEFVLILHVLTAVTLGYDPTVPRSCCKSTGHRINHLLCMPRLYWCPILEESFTYHITGDTI